MLEFVLLFYSQSVCITHLSEELRTLMFGFEAVAQQ